MGKPPDNSSTQAKKHRDKKDRTVLMPTPSDSFTRNLAPAARAVCEIPAINIGILLQSHRDNRSIVPAGEALIPDISKVHMHRMSLASA
jgi:hypothetical protein